MTARRLTLPGGRQIRPPAFTFLKYNTQAFHGRVVTVPDGSIVTDLYWSGKDSFTYGDIGGAGRDNWNLSVQRTFRAHEPFSVDFSAEFTNAFNHTQFRPRMTVALGGTSVLALDAANNRLKIAPGQGNSSSYGTRGDGTFDPRHRISIEIPVLTSAFHIY